MTTKKKTTTAAARSNAPDKSNVDKSNVDKPNGGVSTAAVKHDPAEQQLTEFERAVRLFSQQRFKEACELFTSVAAGPAKNIADKARAYVRVCERKTSAPELELHTAEDHFNYGVERLNARDIEQARTHLGRALSLEPEADHVLYTMALCCGLSGDGSGACENLKRAIELEPRNRILARQDPEFANLSQQIPGLRVLLGFE